MRNTYCPIRSVLLLVSALALAITCSTCRGSSPDPSAPAPSTPPFQPAAPAFLAGPVDLAKGLSAVADDSRYRLGEAYEHTLPHQHVDNMDGKQGSAGNPYVNFEPNWDPSGTPSADGLAYVIYRLGDLTGYTGGRYLRFDWRTAPADWQDFWVGLGDFDHNTWDWLGGPAYPGKLYVPNYTAHVSGDGDMLVLVLFTGTGCPTLDCVVLGETVFDIALEATPTAGPAPLMVDFTVDAQQIYGSTAASYDFDFDGGGVDESGNLTGQASFTYTTPGTYQAEVLVTTDHGETESATIEIIAVNPANVGPTAVILPGGAMGSAPMEVEFTAADSHDNDGGTIRKYEWDFDNDGEFDRDTGTDPVTSFTFGASGDNLVTLRVTDNDLATSTDTATVTISSGWHIQVLDTGLTLNEAPSMNSSGNPLTTIHPTVAYHSYGYGADNTVRFIRATDTTGTAWGSPVEITSGSYRGFHISLGRYNASLLNYVPCVAYQNTDLSSADLMFASATTGTGATWNAPVKVNSSGSAGLDIAIGLATNPVVLSRRDSGLFSYAATDTAGSAWGPPVLVDDAMSYEVIQSPKFIWLDPSATDQPRAFYYWSSHDPAAAEIRMACATDEFASGWQAPVTVVDGLDPATIVVNCSVAIVDGNPAVAYHDGSPATLYYVRANDVDGLTWGEPQPVDSSPDVGLSACLAWWAAQSRPIICYSDSRHNNLLAVFGDNAAGTTWGGPMLVDGAGSVGSTLDMRVCDGTPVVCYSDHTDDTLNSAAFY